MGAVYIYRFNFFVGFIVASAVYYALCRVWPVPATSRVWCEKGDAADRQFSVVYTDAEGYDEERSTATDGDGDGVARDTSGRRDADGEEGGQEEKKKNIYQDLSRGRGHGQ
jgi:NCS1 family nucleobase:cation symporter-1